MTSSYSVPSWVAALAQELAGEVERAHREDAPPVGPDAAADAVDVPARGLQHALRAQGVRGGDLLLAVAVEVVRGLGELGLGLADVELLAVLDGAGGGEEGGGEGQGGEGLGEGHRGLSSCWVRPQGVTSPVTS